MQGLLFTVAITGRHWSDAHERRAHAEAVREEEENVAHLRQVKEAAENQRLKRMIDHERAAMNELRAREVEQNGKMREARDAADEANRAKSAFLAVVSHEIRTPMSGVLGMVRLLMETKLSAQQEEYAQTIQDSSDAMLALLNDILDFEKIESDKMVLEHVDFDLHRLVQGIVTLMNGHASAKGLYLKVDMDETIPRYIIGDPVRLRQVLLNLTGNSIKFTAQGGVTLHIKKPQAPEGTSTEGKAAQSMHRILFSVEDTGIGISPEAQKNLFNPFSQADSSIARKFGGTGLGLTISQRLIEGMGGKIRIDSTSGKGSSFYFTLIVEEGSAEAIGGRLEAGAVSAQKSEKSLRILIVEDNEINQKLLKEFVDRMGHVCSTVLSGEEALERLGEEEFDMLLMDVELPGMTGMGTTKAIRGLPDRAKAALPVIALTGNVREEDRRACYAANMNGYLSKPVDPKRLKGMIDKVIKGTLDNPVVVEAVAEDFTHFNRIPDNNVPADQNAKPATPPAAITTPDSTADMMADAMLLPGLRQGNNSEVLEHEEADGGSQIAPLRALASSITEGVKSAATPKSDVFDQAMLVSLRDSMDAGVFKVMIDGLFEKIDEILAAMVQAHGNGDQKTLIARAHDLKGMAANFGLAELSRLSAAAENAIKQQDTPVLGLLLTSLPAANARAKDELNAWRVAKD